MDKNNQIINGLWVGNKLSPIELLTLHSFVEYGYTFHLWTYEPLNNIIPERVVLMDANEIIPFEKVFKKKEDDPNSNIGKGSFGAPFSDLFRYKLLYERGGWWVDMDVTCLRPLDFSDDYFFRSHPLLPMIGNVMKCPKGSKLMKLVYEEVNSKCDENTAEWLMPNKILNKYIEKLGLQTYIQADTSNNDDWLEIEGLLYTDEIPNENWLYVHWMNEEWRTRRIKKEDVYENTFLHKEYLRHNIQIKVKKRDKSKSLAIKIQKKNRQVRSSIKKWIK